MGVINRILGFYEDIREFNSSNIKDFRGRLKSWIKMGMLAGRIFYLKDMWARDVAALTFASFMALIPFMAMMFVIARGFGYASLLESWLSTTFEAQPVVAQTIVNFVHNYIENTQSNYIIGTGIVMFLSFVHPSSGGFCSDVPVLRVLLLCHPEYLYPGSQYPGSIVPGGCLHDGTSVWIYLSAGFSVQLQCHLWFAGSHSAFPVMASDFVGYRSVWRLALPYQPEHPLL